VYFRTMKAGNPCSRVLVSGGGGSVGSQAGQAGELGSRVWFGSNAKWAEKPMANDGDSATKGDVRWMYRLEGCVSS
jgi:hypothetical protein